MIEKDEARFRAKVALPNREGCMLWLGRRTRDGYGQLWVAGRYESTHRLAYELANGPTPEGLVIDHLCRNRVCAAPLHLEAVTNGENVRRGDTGINNLRKTHCPAGHPYDEINTYITPQGKRKCRPCRRAARKAA